MSNAYLVMEPEQVVAEDLACAIRAFDPEAEVHVVRDLPDAVAMLSQVRPVAMILHEEPARVRSSEAGWSLAGMGVPLAFLETMADARLAGEMVLGSPFTETTVAALLRQLLGGSTDAGTEV